MARFDTRSTNLAVGDLVRLLTEMRSWIHSTSCRFWSVKRLTMNIRRELLIPVSIGLLLFGIAFSLWLVIPRKDPVDRLVALIRRHNIATAGDDECLETFRMGDTALGNRAASRLLELLDDDDPEVRRWSAVYLRQIGADGDLITPKLLEKLRDPDRSPDSWLRCN